MRGFVANGSVVAVVGLSLSACADDPLVDGLFTEAEWMKVSRFSPLPAMPASPTNFYADDDGAALFGKKMFFEKRYSGPIMGQGPGQLGPDGQTGLYSCTECHDTKRWFIDTRSMPGNVSIGAQHTTRRNAPSLVNVSYYDWGGWAGAQDQFWKQGANSPETKDLGGDRLGIAHVIYDHYRAEYNAIFEDDLDVALGDLGRFPPNGRPGHPDWDAMAPDDREIINRILANLGKAFEAYERRLVSPNAPLDKYIAGEFDALSASAKRGLKLFIGKATCAACHQNQTFTDQDFHNTGVLAPGMTPDLGRYDDYAKLDNPFNGAGAYSDNVDAGREKLSGIVRVDTMKGQYRTKSLRHVAHTGPFFHDGSMPTLEAVVRFYNKGGEAEGYPGTKDELMKPLNLTESEIFDLVAFLEALTGEPVPDEWTDPPQQ